MLIHIFATKVESLFIRTKKMNEIFD